MGDVAGNRHVEMFMLARLIMDVEMSRAPYVRLPLCVTTSSRRYLEHGVLRQAVRNRWNLFRYLCLGATAEEIARTYRTRREEAMK